MFTYRSQSHHVCFVFSVTIQKNLQSRPKTFTKNDYLFTPEEKIVAKKYPQTVPEKYLREIKKRWLSIEPKMKSIGFQFNFKTKGNSWKDTYQGFESEPNRKRDSIAEQTRKW